ncbi:hypothetical protein HU200_043581 [Digitaria exilis]|uniref:Peroxidase n=1 Tax=Digitaria exilis TaxID=1010633 RepID=A0A835B363_9POAL|nr:hypothetical protein HU200_043581 [Digitaria exilis]
MGLNAALPVLVATLLAVATLSAAGGGKQPLKVGYYNGKHGGVEPIVRDEVYKTLNVDRSKGAALVRLFFHDCWGCDASVLLNPSSKNPYPEKVAGSNIGLRAFDVIDKIKARLEAVYPGVVSLRRHPRVRGPDGHIDYAVPSGRLDSVVSRAKDADDTLPSSTGSSRPQEELRQQGLRRRGARRPLRRALHRRRTLPFVQGPSTPKYQTALRNAAKNKSRTVANDIRDESYSFKRDAGYYTVVSGRKDYLNNTYYHNAMDNRVLFKSDWVLRTDAFALSKLKEYRDKPKEWDSDFADAMVKLGKLLPAEGEDYWRSGRTTGTKGRL